MKISVCMATYNGAQYVDIQLHSIINQLSVDDEIIVVDDCSTDNTVGIIRSFNDSRINIIVNNSNIGLIKNFEKAVRHATGDIIFLSDQDDEWMDNKVDTVVKLMLTENIDLLQHDAIVINNKGDILYDSWAELRKFGTGIIKNFTINTYVGCCIAFRKEIVASIIPIPVGVQSHDQWIGIMAELSGFKVKFINDKLIKYVRHGLNISSMTRRKLSSVIYGRIKLFEAIFVYYGFKIFK